MMDRRIFDEINERARVGEPFLFVVSYDGNDAFVKPLCDISPSECLFDFNGRTNCDAGIPEPGPVSWSVTPPSYDGYERAFNVVKSNILRGNSYLVNLTCQVHVDCNLSLLDVFRCARGKYKLMLSGRFVCFSPEPFVQIRDGRISSFPMKGTAPASRPGALQSLIADKKEAAEHATIVDLIRNDLSRVASDVVVGRYRYAELVETNVEPLYQTSSCITGALPADYGNHIGDIIAALLPAGSITGAPKAKTVDIIREAENYSRGFYTGVMGLCDHGQVDSAVMIRFLEQSEGGGLVFKAGGGITSRSECAKEYAEVLSKTYLPI